MLNNNLIEDLITNRITNITPGLERITQVLSLLNNPQDKYKVIHIAGTNGKGSTASFIEHGLSLAGFQVGKFTSPHIKQINECICLNGEHISDNELNIIYTEVKELLTQNQLELSPFEFLTVIMFEFFKQQKIDWLVLECGMGGLLDATNVVDSMYSIITNISIEHTQFLGTTLNEIAKHKLGIIKNGFTILGSNTKELLDNMPTDKYISIDKYYNYSVSIDKEKLQTVLKVDGEEFNISLLGEFQAHNFLCAYYVLKDLSLSTDLIKQVAIDTKWDYRLQVVSYNPITILDATHNELGAIAIYNTLSKIYTCDEIVIISSILKDKAIAKMLEIFSQIGDRIILTSINNERGSSTKDLAYIANGKFKHIYSEDRPSDAIILAQSLKPKVILITGSLYLLSDILIKS